jgi:DNA-binding NarL/FixJ family response regulator
MPPVSSELRVLIAESKTLVREFIAELCKRELGFPNIEVSATGPETIGHVVKCRPDVLILDADLPIMDGFEVMETLRRSAVTARTLLLSHGCNAYIRLQAQKASFHGILDITTASLNDMRTAISRIADRGVFFSPQFSRRPSDQANKETSISHLLTNREMSILRLCGQLLSDDDIAVHLCISVATVEKHRFNAQRKLNLNSRIEFLRYAKTHGFR